MSVYFNIPLHTKQVISKMHLSTHLIALVLATSDGEYLRYNYLDTYLKY